MSKAGALNLATGLGGKIDKNDVLSAVDKYEKYHVCHGGEEQERKSNYTDMVIDYYFDLSGSFWLFLKIITSRIPRRHFQVNKYYDLVTSFYEYGWGESFHFAPRWKGESLRESIKRNQHFLALQLGLKPGQKVLDVGCGIGGPLREIARFSSTSVTGLNNNEYQIERGKVGCYEEIYRLLKPGQCFAVYEWCMTDAFDPSNEEHQKIKAEIELGNGLPDIRLTRQCLEALKQAGFEVIWEKDLAVDSPLPWYLPLDKSHFSLGNFRSTALGSLITKYMVMALEKVGLAPKGSQRVQTFLEKAADGLVAGGKKEIFTAVYFFLARKPNFDDLSYVETTF
ncbi:Cycloartenol-C-24-methyltransferase [Forsythia ovata]|uniref:Cycloartenol-C-24-methyltransferase n=1 Tax=Forsythia ovata TaxID=205694 RepID=A0ABD1QR23_9LAMI